MNGNHCACAFNFLCKHTMSNQGPERASPSHSLQETVSLRAPFGVQGFHLYCIYIYIDIYIYIYRYRYRYKHLNMSSGGPTGHKVMERHAVVVKSVELSSISFRVRNLTGSSARASRSCIHQLGYLAGAGFYDT